MGVYKMLDNIIDTMILFSGFVISVFILAGTL